MYIKIVKGGTKRWIKWDTNKNIYKKIGEV